MKETVIIPAQFMEIEDDRVSLLCNIGTYDKPYLEERYFGIGPFKSLIEGFPQFPLEKYCLVKTTIEPGKITIEFDMVENSDEFRKNFIKADDFDWVKDEGIDWLKEDDMDLLDDDY